jgi:hypothetical protein
LPSGCPACFGTPKGGKEREVPLPNAIGLQLSAHIADFPPVQRQAINRHTWNTTWQAALKAPLGGVQLSTYTSW